MTPDSQISAKVIVLLLAVGGGLLYRGWSRRARARRIEDTPRSKLATAPQGFVEIEGFAWPDGAKSILSVGGFNVVYYEFELQRQETRGSGKNRRKEWVTVVTRKHDEVFSICDPTGLALVDPRGAELSLHDRAKTSWGSLSEEKRARVLSLVGAARPDDFPPSAGLLSLFSKPYRIVEREIRVGSPLHVAGPLSSLSDPPLKVRSPGLTRFHSQTMDKEKREVRNLDRLLDKNRDGFVSSDEAREGYAVAAQLSQKRANIEPVDEKEFEIWGLLQNSEPHRLFIADDHEKRLVEKLQRFVWVQVVAGVGCISLAICLMIPNSLPTRVNFACLKWGSGKIRCENREPASAAKP